MHSSAERDKPRVLSGITASGRLTIGNYIGALSVWAEEQDTYENFFFIADLHALTIPENIKADSLRERIQEIVALYLACGLDPAKSVLFQQSRVPAHASLAWIFECVTPVGWLERMTQYKSKSQAATPSAGLFAYPVLMAADILLYQADFNHLFGEMFRMPQPMIRQRGARIMALDDPTIKMSKSRAETHEGHAIGLLDPPGKIRRAVMRAVTDSGTEIRGDALSPGVDNLLTMFEALANTDRLGALRQFEGQQYGTLKKAVAELAIERVGAIQERYAEIRVDETYLAKVLAEGAERAAAVARETLAETMRLTGLL